MSSEHFRRNNATIISLPGKERQLDGEGGGPHDPDMETRVKKLEDDMLLIKTDLGIIKANHATKADVAALETSIHKELHALTWKLIGVAGALVAAVYFVATHAK